MMMMPIMCLHKSEIASAPPNFAKHTIKSSTKSILLHIKRKPQMQFMEIRQWIRFFNHQQKHIMTCDEPNCAEQFGKRFQTCGKILMGSPRRFPISEKSHQTNDQTLQSHKTRGIEEQEEHKTAKATSFTRQKTPKLPFDQQDIEEPARSKSLQKLKQHKSH